MRRILDFAALFVTILVLLGIMIWLRDVDSPTATFANPESVAATGFIMLAAFSMGEFFRLLGAPALLGYIAAGVLFGPNLTPMVFGPETDALFSQNVIENLALINVLTIGVIGTLGGGELKIAELKENLSTILVSFFLVFVIVFAATFGAVLIIADHFPSLLPFLEGRSRMDIYAAAMLFGVFAAAMSPAVTLAIIQENKASGKLSSLTLGTVIIADLTLVGLVLISIQFCNILLSPEGFTTAALLSKVPAIAAEFGYGLLVGVGTGIAFVIYLRFVKKEVLFFTVALIFFASYISTELHGETLLAFLTAGFLVQNFSKQGHTLIHTLETISMPVFVIYFMTQAATLDLLTVADYVWFTVIVFLLRAVAFFIGSRLAVDLLGGDETVRRNLWFGYFSLAGVDLVLAAMVGNAIQPWGPDFQAVIMAQVVLHITIGPPLFKFGLDRAGETEGSRKQTAEEAEAFENIPIADTSELEESFPSHRFEDPELAERVDELRTILVDLHSDFIAEPLRAKQAALDASLREASEELAEALDALHVVLTSDQYTTPQKRAEAVIDVHVDYLGAIADNVQTWEQINPEIVHHDRIQELVEAVRGREEFTSVYRVPHEEFLLRPDDEDPATRRVMMGLRRLRVGAFGLGTRHVPLGRLWRYHVELMMTRYLARAVNATSILNERFWADLGNHMRRVDDLFDAVYDAVGQSADEPEPQQQPEPDSPPDADDADSSGEQRSPVIYGSRALRILAEGREAVAQREGQLDAELRALTETAVDRYTVSLRETFTNFLSAAEIAGTYQLPQWKYRPSTLFDAARRAETKILDRLRREQTIVTGHRGWIVVEWQLVLFLYWLADYEASVRETLASLVERPLAGQIDVLATLCQSLPEELAAEWDDVSAVRQAVESADADGREWPDVDWEVWLSEHVRPQLERARQNFQRMIGLYDKGFVARRLVEPLERRVGEFSEQIVLLSEHPDQLGADQRVPTLTLRLREWFESEVVRETALRLVEFDERGEAITRTSLAGLEELQQVLEFNLLTADRDAAAVDDPRYAVDVATGGLERAARMVDEMRDAQHARFQQLATWIIGESSQIAERAAEPFLQHRHSEIERIMARRGQTTLAARGESWAMSVINAVASTVRGTYRRMRPVIGEVSEELRSLFGEDAEPIRHADIRDRLRPNERLAVTIPVIYRRLFTPVPLDIPDFYVARKDVEAACVEAIYGWVQGKPNTILVHGDRGMGKRSTIQHLLQHSPELAGLRAECEIHNVVLEDDLQSGAEIAARIVANLPAEPAALTEGLVRFFDLVDARYVIVVENGEKLFSRTKSGLEMAKHFFSAMNETSSSVLWIVLMGTPAVTYLDTAVGVFDYFTHALEIEPLPEEALERMIQRRHRVSGFRADFDRETPRIRDWLARPLGTSDALRDPQSEFFGDLARLSGGNPMIALLYWLESSRLDESDDHLIWLSALPQSEPELLSSVSLTKRLILAALVQHHTLTPTQLQAILRRDLDEVQTELDHLQRLGFVRQLAGRPVVAYRLRDLPGGLVTMSLRNMNMI